MWIGSGFFMHNYHGDKMSISSGFFFYTHNDLGDKMSIVNGGFTHNELGDKMSIGRAFISFFLHVLTSETKC